MPFKPGQSGNPSGRPKGEPTFRQICKRRGVNPLQELATVIFTGSFSDGMTVCETSRCSLLKEGAERYSPKVKMIATAELTTEQILDVLAADDADEGDE